jgi:hypothetical protein
MSDLSERDLRRRETELERARRLGLEFERLDAHVSDNRRAVIIAPNLQQPHCGHGSAQRNRQPADESPCGRPGVGIRPYGGGGDDGSVGAEGGCHQGESQDLPDGFLHDERIIWLDRGGESRNRRIPVHFELDTTAQ